MGERKPEFSENKIKFLEGKITLGAGEAMMPPSHPFQPLKVVYLSPVQKLLIYVNGWGGGHFAFLRR